MPYNEAIKRLMQLPSGGKKDSYYNVVGEHTSRQECSLSPSNYLVSTIKFSFCVDKGVILQARHDTFGDPAVTAAAALVVSEAKGKTIEEVGYQFTVEAIAKSLDISATSVHFNACQVARFALVSALNNYKEGLE